MRYKEEEEEEIPSSELYKLLKNWRNKHKKQLRIGAHLDGHDMCHAILNAPPSPEGEDEVINEAGWHFQSYEDAEALYLIKLREMSATWKINIKPIGTICVTLIK